MKKYKPILLVIIAITFFQYNLKAQNPIWTMPPYKFVPDLQNYTPLPTSPNGETNPGVAYQGTSDTHLHGAYTDPFGELLLFTVDQKVYDKYGYVVDDMQINSDYKRGFSERLILPMGKDCSRFAIIYAASSDDDERYYSKLFGRRLYMAEYDMDAQNLVTQMQRVH